MHLILTGATGLVGTAVLDAMIRAKDITKISVLSRRPVKFTDDRIDVILHKNFTSLTSFRVPKLGSGRWALAKVKEYITITKTMPLAAAKAFQSLPSAAGTRPKTPFHFVYVSGAGATFNPGRLTPFFGHIKGEAELALGKMQEANPSALRVTSVRPAFVDWTGHEEIKAFLPEFGVVRRTLGSIMSPIVQYAAKNSWSPTEPLGKFLTGVATGMWDGALEGEGIGRLPSGLTVIENTGLRRVMGLVSARAG